MPGGDVMVIAVVAAMLYYGVGKTVTETKVHVVRPVKHAITRFIKHEKKTN